MNNIDEALKEMGGFRNQVNDQNRNDRPDYIIRVCQAIVADKGGYSNRVDWRHLQRRN